MSAPLLVCRYGSAALVMRAALLAYPRLMHRPRAGRGVTRGYGARVAGLVAAWRLGCEASDGVGADFVAGEVFAEGAEAVVVVAARVAAVHAAAMDLVINGDER